MGAWFQRHEEPKAGGQPGDDWEQGTYVYFDALLHDHGGAGGAPGQPSGWCYRLKQDCEWRGVGRPAAARLPACLPTCLWALACCMRVLGGWWPLLVCHLLLCGQKVSARCSGCHDLHPDPGKILPDA